MDIRKQTPEMTLAIYASTAATVAIKALIRTGMLSDEPIDELAENLRQCLRASRPSPRLEQHVELLIHMLLVEKQKNQ